MASTSARFALAVAFAAFAPAISFAEPLNVVRAPATDKAPVRVEAAMFGLDVNLAKAGKLSDLLLQSGVNQADAASVAALAQTQVDGSAPVRVKLGLTRNPDSGAVSVERLVLSTETMQAVIEQRSGKLRVVSAAPRKLHTV